MEQTLTFPDVVFHELPSPVGSLCARRGIGRFVRATLLIFGVSLLGGCHSSTIRASRMPNDLQAKARHRSSVVDLTKFSSPGVSDALIGPRDLLKVTVASGRTDEKPSPVMVRVGNDGAVKIPLIGSVPVAGKEAYDASQSIVDAAVAGGIYVHPYVTVEIESKAVRSVTVLGAVSKPGVHELPYENCSLVTALAAAGGLTEDAGTEVQIIRQPTLGLLANEAAPGPDFRRPVRRRSAGDLQRTWRFKFAHYYRTKSRSVAATSDYASRPSRRTLRQLSRYTAWRPGYCENQSPIKGVYFRGRTGFASGTV